MSDRVGRQRGARARTVKSTSEFVAAAAFDVSANSTAVYRRRLLFEGAFLR